MTQKEGSPTQARRGRGHGDREKAGTGAGLFVLWAGAGFPWEIGDGGAQWGRPGENAQEGVGGRESEGYPCDGGSPGPGPGPWISSKRKNCYFSMLKMQEAAKFSFLRQNQRNRCFRGSFVDTSGSFLDKKKNQKSPLNRYFNHQK